MLDKLIDKFWELRDKTCPLEEKSLWARNYCKLLGFRYEQFKPDTFTLVVSKGKSTYTLSFEGDKLRIEEEIIYN